MTETKSAKQIQYQQGLEDPRWKKLRLQVMARDKHQCRICGATENLYVHHRQYHKCKHNDEWLQPWDYHPVFLVTLCGKCHQLGHQQYSIPIKNV